MAHWEEMWRFSTPNYTVAAEVAPCEDDPADSFEFDDDIQAVRDGSVDWFDVRVRVLARGREIGADYLCCCAYTTADEFFTGHRDPDPLNRNSSVMRAVRGENVAICHYFPSMVSEAIRKARATAISPIAA